MAFITRYGPPCLAALPVALALLGGWAVAGAQVAPAPKPADPTGATVPSIAAIIAAMPKNLPRAAGPGLDESIAAARAAVRYCDGKGAKISALVTDAAGQPIVLLSGDGAGFRSQLIARTKAHIAVRYGMPSGEVEQRSHSDARLAAEAAADPEIGVLRGGGFPITRGGKLIGAVAVSGATLTGPVGLDEECAQVALKML
jgi:uncharacterized protein GlcG (DUF336 family)